MTLLFVYIDCVKLLTLCLWSREFLVLNSNGGPSGSFETNPWRSGGLSIGGPGENVLRQRSGTYRVLSRHHDAIFRASLQSTQKMLLLLLACCGCSLISIIQTRAHRPISNVILCNIAIPLILRWCLPTNPDHSRSFWLSNNVSRGCRRFCK